MAILAKQLNWKTIVSPVNGSSSSNIPFIQLKAKAFGHQFSIGLVDDFQFFFSASVNEQTINGQTFDSMKGAKEKAQEVANGLAEKYSADMELVLTDYESAKLSEFLNQ